MDSSIDFKSTRKVVRICNSYYILIPKSEVKKLDNERTYQINVTMRVVF